jgi:hypothetical protein
MILNALDTRLEELGVPFCRFVDDIRLFADSQAEAGRQLHAVLNELGAMGLGVNRSKLRQESAGEYLDGMRSGWNHGIETKLRPEDGRTEVKDLLFDPYAQLVVTHAEELKRISDTATLDEAIRLEADKLIPHASRLKILIAALAYSPIPERSRAFQALLPRLATPAFFGFLPRVIRTLEDMDGELESGMQAQIIADLETPVLDRDSWLPPSVRAQFWRVLACLAGEEEKGRLHDQALTVCRLSEATLFERREAAGFLVRSGRVAERMEPELFCGEPWLESGLSGFRHAMRVKDTLG